MAGCWICTNRIVVTIDDVPVGCCINCHVLACNQDGDRLQKSEFWCVVCLQWAAVQQSGLVGVTERPDEALADPSTPRVRLDGGGDGGLPAQAPRLVGTLEAELREADQMWSDRPPEVKAFADVQGAPEIRLDLLRLATALAIRAVGGSNELLAGARSVDRARLLPAVHPALADYLAVAGPMIA